MKAVSIDLKSFTDTFDLKQYQAYKERELMYGTDEFDDTVGLENELQALQITTNDFNIPQVINRKIVTTAQILKQFRIARQAYQLSKKSYRTKVILSCDHFTIPFSATEKTTIANIIDDIPSDLKSLYFDPFKDIIVTSTPQYWIEDPMYPNTDWGACQFRDCRPEDLPRYLVQTHLGEKHPGLCGELTAEAYGEACDPNTRLFDVPVELWERGLRIDLRGDCLLYKLGVA